MKGSMDMTKVLLDNGVVVELKEVPREETPQYWLEQHSEFLEQRETSRELERQKTMETVKDMVIGGILDETNRRDNY